MNSTAKILVPGQEWLVRTDEGKLGALSKSRKGYTFFKNGEAFGFKNLNDARTQLGIELFEESLKKNSNEAESKTFAIYDYPCRTKPFDPVYNVKEKLPLYAKNIKSKSRYCAGYYVIKFRKGWIRTFCPKLITLQRYPYFGPFKTEAEVKSVLNNVNSKL
jgi:hypothetical protein